MGDEIIISLVDVVGDGICVTDDDGQKLYELIVENFSNGNSVKLSFDGVIDLTSAFLNTAIGQLYGHFEEDFIRNNLSVTDISDNDVVILSRVVERAKSFFDNPEPYINAASDVLGDDGDC